MILRQFVYGSKIPAWARKGIGSSAGGREMLQRAIGVPRWAENTFSSETKSICYTEWIPNSISNKIVWPLFCVNVFSVTRITDSASSKLGVQFFQGMSIS